MNRALAFTSPLLVAQLHDSNLGMQVDELVQGSLELCLFLACSSNDVKYTCEVFPPATRFGVNFAFAH